MARPNIPWTLARRARVLASACAAASLAACGGGSELESGPVSAASSGAGTTAQASAPSVSPFDAETAQIQAQPFFHVAPVELDPPSDVDAWDNTASARLPVKVQKLPSEMASLPTRGLTLESIWSEKTKRGLAATGKGAPAVPMAAAMTVSTYTPAQIRAAYGLPELPVLGANLSAAQAAQLGAGQTIYIVDAYHNPNVVAELNAFNQKFGLPGCTTQTISPSASLPLPSASLTGGCSFSVVYSTPSATMTSAAPAYQSGWATEITLDVQWAHATAPLARIVLIEAPNASLDGLGGAVRLANAMGPGVVSMSFGSPEGSWMASVDSAFTRAGMTYLAATGDSGAGVSWPAASSNVLAVGGTSLNFSGSGARTELAWSGSGGGVSQYVGTPSYQTKGVPGVGSLARRAVPDVAFNANPSTGQYIAQMPPGASTVSWLSVGGTSLSTPQWAGVVAVANAMRAQAGKTVLGLTQSSLYGDIGSVPGNYYNAFLDVTSGSNGSCALCTARAGFDVVTGLGTPNVPGLLSALSVPALAVAPTVNPATISALVGTPLAFNVSYTASGAVKFALSGAPAGMAVSASGAVSWAAPVVGKYAVTVSATDLKSGLAGKGVYTVSVSAPAPVPPVVKGSSINGLAGSRLSFQVAYTAPNAVSFALAGAPAGMTVSSTGAVVWTTPKAGSYAVTVTVTDTKTRLTGKGVYTVVIAAPAPPVVPGPTITAPAITGTAGKGLTASIQFATPGSASYWVSVTGVPAGAWLTLVNQSLQLNWPSPVSGKYTLNVVVKDGSGRSASAAVPVTINPR